MGDTHILGNFQKLAEASPDFDLLAFKDLEERAVYQVRSVQQTMPIRRFGHLISHALPVRLHPDSLIMRLICRYRPLKNATESFLAGGRLLMHGFVPKQQFMGTWYNDQTRILGDFGSQLYIVERIKTWRC